MDAGKCYTIKEKVKGLKDYCFVERGGVMEVSLSLSLSLNTNVLHILHTIKQITTRKHNIL